MTDIILSLIIAGLLIKSYFDEQSNKKERESLMKAVIAKNLQEYTESDTIKEAVEPEPPQEVPMDQVSDELFAKHLENITNGSTEDGETTE
jgi:hypothetical protein